MLDLEKSFSFEEGVNSLLLSKKDRLDPGFCQGKSGRFCIPSVLGAGEENPAGVPPNHLIRRTLIRIFCLQGSTPVSHGREQGLDCMETMNDQRIPP